jgi:hypothetical protein
MPFRVAAAVEVLNRAPGKPSSVPGLDLGLAEGAGARELFDPDTVRRYQALLARIATPYRIDRFGNYSRSEYPSYGLDGASGLVATARDLANFESSLDRRRPQSHSDAHRHRLVCSERVGRDTGMDLRSHSRRELGVDSQDAAQEPDVDHAVEQRRPGQWLQLRAGRCHDLAFCEGVSQAVHLN